MLTRPLMDAIKTIRLLSLTPSFLDPWAVSFSEMVVGRPSQCLVNARARNKGATRLTSNILCKSASRSVNRGLLLQYSSLTILHVDHFDPLTYAGISNHNVHLSHFTARKLNHFIDALGILGGTMVDMDGNAELF